MSQREIVVGFDGSAMSAAALRWAAEQCRMTGAMRMGRRRDR
jgi:hypothetical protein